MLAGKYIRLAVWSFLAASAYVGAVSADAITRKSTEVPLNSLFSHDVDLLGAKLAVDAMIDNATDGALIREQIQSMTDDVMAMLSGQDVSSDTKLDALRKYLFDSGSWNNFAPFRYDMNDPLGKEPANRLLRTYLKTKKGNCITMPLLMTIIGRKLGLELSLAQAPLHLFIMYHDDSGRIFNLESTNGGTVTRDVWYRKKLPMSEKSIAKGVYLRPLSSREEVAVVLSSLLDNDLSAGDYEEAITISDYILKHHPRFSYAYVKRGSAFHGLIRKALADATAKEKTGDRVAKSRLDYWYAQNRQAFDKAESLGWYPQEGNLQPD